ncbi:MAG: FKBP-type peptidyl-prolyl cis-trans isomerase [Chromatiales bacterium]|nr:FKBP-type peptidyl-prolyl cis-trans isomerase [Chromatiales bacterium]
MKSPFLRSLCALAVVGATFSVTAAELQTVEQKFSYALGVRYAQQFKSQDAPIDGTAFGAALNDVYAGKDLQLSPEEMQKAITDGRALIAKVKQEQAAKKLEEGRAYLAENKKQEGVVELPSGLQYQVIAEGSGESPTDNSQVTVHYTGTLMSGAVFDSSHKRGEPASFMVTGVIPGFSEALKLMKPGAKWRVFIPSELGYGPRGAGSAIGPNETLIFELELISFKEMPKQEEEKPADAKPAS